MTLLFDKYQAKQFQNPILLDMSTNNNSYVGTVKLTPNVNYGVVTSAIFHKTPNTLLQPPRISIDGKTQKLIGGNSIFPDNLRIKFQWVKAYTKSFQKQYFGSFSTKEPCTCIIKIERHSKSYLSSYTLELHKNVDESYFWLGGMTFFCVLFTILISWIYIPIILIKNLWLWLISLKKRFL